MRHNPNAVDPTRLVILTHFPDRNNIPYKRFKIVMAALIGAACPERINDIEFQIGDENMRGINAIELNIKLDDPTSRHLQDKLKEFLEQDFKITYHGKTVVNRQAQINQAATRLHEQLDS